LEGKVDHGDGTNSLGGRENSQAPKGGAGVKNYVMKLSLNWGLKGSPGKEGMGKEFHKSRNQNSAVGDEWGIYERTVQNLASRKGNTVAIRACRGRFYDDSEET